MSLRIATVLGARPQFVKAFPFSRAVAQSGFASEIIINTGQHFDFDMAGVFYEQLNIPRPKYDLGIQSLSHGAMTGRMLEKIEDVLIKEKPDLMLLYGDTNSTLAGAIAAAKMFVPIAHVEAGVRTFLANPEEINRKVTDHVSSFLFCSTNPAVEALRDEGIRGRIYNVGDIMMDSHRLAGDIIAAQDAGEPDNGDPYILLTLHRDENTRDPAKFMRIIDYVRGQANGRPIIFPIHPRTVKFCQANGITLDDIETTGPVGYLEMYRLAHRASMIMTDSGGLQKEAYWHRVPCVTLFELSPWPETIDNGWNRLWTDDDWKPRREFDDYGNGHTAELILEKLEADWPR
jgi:UDP-GlcNAc3NAcA epimerase